MKSSFGEKLKVCYKDMDAFSIESKPKILLKKYHLQVASGVVGSAGRTFSTWQKEQKGSANEVRWITGESRTRNCLPPIESLEYSIRRQCQTECKRSAQRVSRRS